MAAAAQTLGRYRLERKIGSGAMGLVYEALDPKLNRPVAIKTILKSQLDEEVSREYSVRFREEAQAVARLNHPNIVQVYDFGEEGDVAFIVMEFIRGKDLKHCFDTHVRFEAREFVRLMCELLSALEYAHQAGIVHRDIKPANIMLDSQNRAKLMDFGVAKITDTDRTHRTQVGTMVGTPSYMSPEQVQGLACDHRSDLFSSGIVLYQFLTNQRPFTGGDWTLRKMIVHEDPVRPSQINAAISPEFDRVVSRALAKAPEARYQSAGDFSRALQRVFEGKPAEDEEEGTVMRVYPAPAGPPPVRPAETRPPATPPEARTSPTGGSQEVEVEFWRSIKDSDEAEDYELYLQQFPQGAYARLAERKIAKLRKGAADAATGSGSHAASEASAARAQAEERARQEAEARAKRESAEKLKREAEEKARLEAERVRRESEEKARREAEARARREAEEKARLEAAAKAKRDAEDKARREAEERARLEQERVRREAEAKARQEAEEKAQRAAEEKALREQERARREAEAKARLEAEAKAKREAAEEKARREAEVKARREAEARAKLEAEAKAKREAAEEKARREAEEKARREAQEKARRAAAAEAKRESEEETRRKAEARAWQEEAEREAEARIAGVPDLVDVPKAPRRSPLVIPAITAGVVVIGAAASYFALRSPQEAPVVAAQQLPQIAKVDPRPEPAPPAPAVRAPAPPKADDAAKREAEEKAKREAEDKSKREAEEKAKRDAEEKAKTAEERARRERAEQEERGKARLAAEEKKREAARLAEERRKQLEAAKSSAEEKKREAARLAAEEAKKRETARLAAEEAKKREAARLAEEAKQRETARLAEEEKKRTAAKLAEEQKRARGPELYRQASELESQGKVSEAVKLYTAAANANHGPSAKRLGDIFSGGKGDVAQDYTASLRWHERARRLGETVQVKGR